MRSNNNKWHNLALGSKSTNQLCRIRTNTVVVLLLLLVVITTNTVLTFPHVSSAQINSVPVTPFKTRAIAPQIAMIYTGKDYHGTLISYTTNNTSPNTGNSPTLGESLVTPTNITSPANTSSTTATSNNVISIKRGSSISFIVRNSSSSSNNNNNYTNNNLANSLPSSLSITAYDLKGKPVILLNTTERSNTISAIVNLNSGRYILLAVATWLPQPTDKTRTGFVSYSYNINVLS